MYSSLIEALERSRKIVIVLSNSFLKSEKCRGLADLAGMKLVADLERLLKDSVIRRKYPTGQNYSLELMFAKFATAKNRKKN